MKLNFLWLVLAIAPTSLFAQTTVVIDPVAGTTLTVYENTPLQGLKENKAATEVNVGDDGRANVPLPFLFPFYGEEFNSSWMHSNGAVNFSNTYYNFCCNGSNLVTYSNDNINYSIMPMWTDLMSKDNQTYYLGTDSSMTYGWYGVTEYGTHNSNAFEVTIYDTGNITFSYDHANVKNHVVTIGLVGDINSDEYVQLYTGTGYNLDSTMDIQVGVDPCILNPLYSSSCAGYQQAYHNYQCSINPLYDSQCPDYESAHFIYECQQNPLYDRECIGFEEAYVIDNQDTDIPTTEQLLTTTTFTIDSIIAEEPVLIQEQLLEDSIEDVFTETVEAEVVIKEVLGTSKDKKEAISEKVAELKKELASAKTTKEQMKIQSQLVVLMAYVPSFEAYTTTLPDASFYSNEQIYQGNHIADTRSGLRMGLASELKYNEMLTQQYERE